MTEHDGITIDDLYGQQRDIAETIGLKAYIELTKTFGGDELYIQKYTELLKIPRNKSIRAEFTGYNSAELARKYDLSERYVRDICSDLIDAKRSAPPPGQLSFWDCR